MPEEEAYSLFVAAFYDKKTAGFVVNTLLDMENAVSAALVCYGRRAVVI